MSKKVLVAMSGGVDSSVAAYLLMKDGYECIGGTMLLHSNVSSPEESVDVRDAKQVAARLGIEHVTFDLREEFRKNVMQEFADVYLAGDTPNPCVTCNKTMKFGLLLEKARELGCEYVATGHYVQKQWSDADQSWYLQKAADHGKDQSYYLGLLSQDQIAHALFPLGGMTKPEIRAIAAAQGFATAGKHDSQDVCFIPDGDYAAFLESYLHTSFQPGPIVDLKGTLLGTHQGAIRYTLGQRKGLGVSSITPLYVCGKSMAENTVTLAEESHLFHKSLLAEPMTWASGQVPPLPLSCSAKVRSRHREQPCTVTIQEDGTTLVHFQEPQRAITSGQTLVLYQDDLVLGGAAILRTLEEA